MVQQFGQTHRDVLVMSAPAQRLLAAIDTSIGDLEAAGVRKDNASVARQGQQKAQARRALTDLIKQGAQLTRTLRAAGHTVPPCDPPVSRSGEALLIAARRLAEVAADHAADFDDHQLSSARITAVADAYVAAVANRNEGRLGHVAAATNIDRLTKAAMRQVKLLDLIVVTLFHGQDIPLRDWRLAQQVEEVRGRKRKEGGSEPAPETAPAAPSTSSEQTPPAVAA